MCVCLERVDRKKGLGDMTGTRFIQTRDDFDPTKNCGLCGDPLNEDGDFECQQKEIERLKQLAHLVWMDLHRGNREWTGQ